MVSDPQAPGGVSHHPQSLSHPVLTSLAESGLSADLGGEGCFLPRPLPVTPKAGSILSHFKVPLSPWSSTEAITWAAGWLARDSLPCRASSQLMLGSRMNNGRLQRIQFPRHLLGCCLT